MRRYKEQVGATKGLNKPVSLTGVLASFWEVASPAKKQPPKKAPTVPKLCHPRAARPDARKSGPLVLGPVICITTSSNCISVAAFTMLVARHMM